MKKRSEAQQKLPFEVRNAHATNADGPKPDAMRVLSLLVKMVVSFYPNDPSAPSVLFSQIGENLYYASITRYKERTGEAKFVVCSARAPSIDLVAVEVARAWFEKVGLDAVALLAEPRLEEDDHKGKVEVAVERIAKADESTLDAKEKLFLEEIREFEVLDVHENDWEILDSLVKKGFVKDVISKTADSRWRRVEPA